MPGHLLRRVFETATDFVEARELLSESPVAAPCIYVLAGTRPEDTAVIERTEENAAVHGGAKVAANHWEAVGWRGSARGQDSVGRARMLDNLAVGFDPAFGWLQPPVLNPLTRLAMVADAAEGRLIAQGYEQEAPATAPLELVL